MGSLAGEARQTVGHYSLHGEIGGGGMATVHFGRMVGALGFKRTVAIKRLHPAHVKDPHFVSMFMDEARLAARVRHPNVVQTLDVVLDDGELFLVLEYVHGVSLAHLMKTASAKHMPVPMPVAAAVIAGALHGLHAAHEATDETGAHLEIVHRDVSPQNILVSGDGSARVLDFGVAKAAGRKQHTAEGQLKGKLAYMAPEQVTGVNVTRRCDVFAASIVFWELVTAKRLFRSDTESETIAKVVGGPIPIPSSVRPDLTPLDAVVLKGLERDPNARYASAREMARAIETAIHVASSAEVGEWVESLVGDELAELSERVSHLESEGGRLISATEPDPDPMSRSSVVTKKEASKKAEKNEAGVTRTESTPSLSPNAPVDAPSAMRRRAPLLIALAVGSVVGVIAFRETGARVRATAATAEPSASSFQAVPPAIADTAVANPEASSSPPLDLGDLPESAASGAHRTHVKASHPAPSASSAVLATPSTVVPAPDCNPPYYEGDDGRRHYKPACFHTQP